jgi:hypothetical protein
MVLNNKNGRDNTHNVESKTTWLPTDYTKNTCMILYFKF